MSAARALRRRADSYSRDAVILRQSGDAENALLYEAIRDELRKVAGEVGDERDLARQLEELREAATYAVTAGDRWVDKGGDLPLYVSLGLKDLRLALEPPSAEEVRAAGEECLDLASRLEELREADADADRPTVGVVAAGQYRVKKTNKPALSGGDAHAQTPQCADGNHMLCPAWGCPCNCHRAIAALVAALPPVAGPEVGEGER